jgi:biotin carboxyl carrier protein
VTPLAFDVVINGRPWNVAIEAGAAPGQFNVAVNGRTRAVDVSWIDRDTLSLLDDGASSEVRVHQREVGALVVAIDGRTFEAQVSNTASPRESFERRAGRAVQDPSYIATKAGPHTIKAPMPGRIVRVLVAVGDRVSARQPVVIVEAMKMENELRSSGTGVVKEIRVQQGQAIDTGVVLLVIDYAASL